MLKKRPVFKKAVKIVIVFNIIAIIILMLFLGAFVLNNEANKIFSIEDFSLIFNYQYENLTYSISPNQNSEANQHSGFNLLSFSMLALKLNLAEKHSTTSDPIDPERISILDYNLTDFWITINSIKNINLSDKIEFHFGIFNKYYDLGSGTNPLLNYYTMAPIHKQTYNVSLNNLITNGIIPDSKFWFAFYSNGKIFYENTNVLSIDQISAGIHSEEG